MPLYSTQSYFVAEMKQFTMLLMVNGVDVNDNCETHRLALAMCLHILDCQKQLHCCLPSPVHRQRR